MKDGDVEVYGCLIIDGKPSAPRLIARMTRDDWDTERPIYNLPLLVFAARIPLLWLNAQKDAPGVFDTVPK